MIRPDWMISAFKKRKQKKQKKLTDRESVVAWAKWGVKHEPSIHYAEIRPIPVHDKPGQLPLTTDCSGFATLCYKWSDCPDPNGNHYSGEGFTGTLLAHGRPVSMARPGDLVIYGEDTGHHVAVCVTGGHDPMTVSHGQERGPIFIKVSEEMIYQPKGVRFRSFLP